MTTPSEFLLIVCHTGPERGRAEVWEEEEPGLWREAASCHLQAPAYLDAPLRDAAEQWAREKGFKRPYGHVWVAGPRNYYLVVEPVVEPVAAEQPEWRRAGMSLDEEFPWPDAGNSVVEASLQGALGFTPEQVAATEEPRGTPPVAPEKEDDQ